MAGRSSTVACVFADLPHAVRIAPTVLEAEGGVPFHRRTGGVMLAKTDARPLCTVEMPSTLQALSTFQACEILVERAKRRMACLLRDREYQTVRETKNGARTEMGKRLPNDVRIL
jgi:hypothetical protein